MLLLPLFSPQCLHSKRCDGVMEDVLWSHISRCLTVMSRDSEVQEVHYEVNVSNTNSLDARRLSLLTLSLRKLTVRGVFAA